MPSVAQFIQEILSEDRFSNAYNERIDTRLKELNPAQIQGMYSYLQKVEKRSFSKLWKESHHHLISKLEVYVKRFEQEQAEEKKRKEAVALKEAQKLQTLKGKEREKRKVLQNIQSQCEKTAREDVINEEIQRQLDEKNKLMKESARLDIVRNRYFYLAGSYFLLMLGGMIYGLASPLFFSACFLFVLSVTGWLVWKGLKYTMVLPSFVPEEEFVAKISKRSADLLVDAEKGLEEKEREFRRQQRMDRRERRARIERKKADQEQKKRDLENNFHLLLGKSNSSHSLPSSHISSLPPLPETLDSETPLIEVQHSFPPHLSYSSSSSLLFPISPPDIESGPSSSNDPLPLPTPPNP